MSSGGSSHQPQRCLYETLGVEITAAATEIKQAYRREALKYHPDRNVGNEAQAKLDFQEVSHAHEVLSNAQERAWYDSHRISILSGGEDGQSGETVDLCNYFFATAYCGFGDDPKSFYAVYEEAFGAIFSAEKDKYDAAAPPFGLGDAPYVEVKLWYEWWGSFRSKSSFAWKDEYNVNEAENRRERRWMEKENMRLRSDASKAYSTEVQSLLNFVRRRDRRILEQAARRQKKQEEEKIRQQEEEQRRIQQAKEAESLAAETLRKEKEAQRAIAAKAKTERDARRKELRLKRKSVRESLAGEASVSSDDVTFFCEVADEGVLNKAILELECEGGVFAFKDLLQSLRFEKENRDALQAEASNSSRAEFLKKFSNLELSDTFQQRPWSENEISMLAKSVRKFPPGTKNRWCQIAEFITQQLQLKEPRRKEECIAKSQEMSQAPMSKTKHAGGEGNGGTLDGEADSWTTEQQRELEQALTDYPATMEKNERWKNIAAAVNGKTVKQCVTRYRRIREQLKSRQQLKQS